MVNIHRDITLGRRIRQTAFDGMTINEVVYPGGFRLAPHAHEHANISVLLAGSFHERAGTVATACRTCGVVFKPPQTEHGNEVGRAGARTLIIEIQRERFESLCQWSETLKRYAWTHTGPVPELMLRLYREFRLGDDLSAASLEQLLIEVLSTDFKVTPDPAVSGTPRWLQGIMHRLCDCDGAPPPPVADLAAEAGVHPVYLARVFRRHHRCTIAQYVRRRRLERALHELSTSRRSLAEIAIDTGFADQAHFSRAFKAHAGLTPGQFRKLARVPAIPA